MRLKIKNEHINLLFRVCDEEKARRLLQGITNPAKYSWISDELEKLYIQLKNSQQTESYIEEFVLLLEDELAYAQLICQDSKCDSLKYINYSSKKDS